MEGVEMSTKLLIALEVCINADRFLLRFSSERSAFERSWLLG